MKRRRWVRGILEFTIVQFLLTGCVILDATSAPTSIATRTPTSTSTFTPDPCTGWWCSVTGVVYDGTASMGNEVEGVTVTLAQYSNCSSTSGEYQTTTSIDGSFEFGEIFLHDTDRVQIRVNVEGEDTVLWDSIDFYCFYCSCFGSPLEVVLPATPSP